MITFDNLLDEYPKLEQSELPDPLQQPAFEDIVEMLEFYDEDDTIAETVDLFIEKLNEYANHGIIYIGKVRRLGEKIWMETSLGDIYYANEELASYFPNEIDTLQNLDTLKKVIKDTLKHHSIEYESLALFL